MVQIGIIGLPNAGKSTLFNALLKKQQALVASYPFTTIEPNVGVVGVPDKRLPIIVQLIGSQKQVPALIKFIDIAGLVKDAHKGEGLGNQFLAHIKEVDLICHVLRDFSDPRVTHVTGEINPNKDKEIVEIELTLKDLEVVKAQKSILRLRSGQEIKDQSPNQNVKITYNLITKIESGLNSVKQVSDMVFSDKEKEVVKNWHLLTIKPVIYVLNVAEKDLDKSTNQLINLENLIIICAKLEAELAGLSGEEQKEYLKSLSLERSGLERLIQKAYQTLGLITFYSGNEKQTTAWSIQKGTQAVEAAAVVHTDFARKIIKAEVVSYDDFVNCSGWKVAREQGKTRFEGRNYQVQDQDIIDFKISS